MHELCRMMQDVFVAVFEFDVIAPFATCFSQQSLEQDGNQFN